jgi:predicted PurR-regulated permease PerM
VTLPETGRDKAYLKRALEVTINIGLVILLAVTCFLILRPFVPLISWGIIIAVATYPGFLKLERLLHGHGGAAAALCTIVFLAILIVPAVLLTDSLLEGIQNVSARLKEGGLVIPPPPQTVAAWPVVGPPLSGIWALASTDLSQAIRRFAPELKAAVPGLISASAGLGLTVLQLFLAILVSGALLAKAKAAARVTRALAIRLFAEKGPEYQQLIGQTIRNVTFGILGVALIQTLAAAVGFLVVGIPGLGFWIVTFLFAAVLQAGGIVLIPAVIYVFASTSTTKAVVFLIWCIIVALMDNVLKPILLGRGSAVPIAVVFLGAIGGFMGMGILGLFIGAIVLSVGYKLFLAWLRDGNMAEQTIGEP